MSEATTTPSPNRALFAAAAESIPVIGKMLAKVILDGRLALLAGVVASIWLLFVYPLLMPLLTAAIINTGMLASMHEPYARQVRKAFHADEFASEMASKSNKLLDYFQVIEFVGAANEARDYSLSASTNQYVRIRAERATLFTVDPENCPLPAQLARVAPPGAVRVGPKIFTLKIAGEPVADVNVNPKAEPIVLTAAQWATIASKSDAGRIEVVLAPIQALEEMPCSAAKADVRLTFEVFKDLVPGVALAAAGR